MFEHLVLEIQVFFVFVLYIQYITDVKVLVWDMHANVAGLRGYHTLQGDNSLKSVERFDHMMFVCRFQASR